MSEPFKIDKDLVSQWAGFLPEKKEEKPIDMGPSDMYGKKSEDLFWPYSAGNWTGD